ncbi:MAG: type II secretion system protein [Nitrospirae bacterium]|nr:type II secretion system protein [Nitrospirota bacterium]
MNTKGFTLIEVILVIVIMAIAIPGLISAVSFITAQQVNMVGTTTAADLAQEEMENIIAKKQSSCGTCGYANTPPTSCATPLVGTFAAVSGFPNYQKKTDAVCVDSSLASVLTDQGYKEITVTVQAVGVGPSVPNAVLVTLVTNY